jgi:hypothetical protein
MIKYNTKCVIQGGLLVLIWWAASKGHLEGPTLISGAGIFWLFYVLNANLDEKYGCEHGELYK